MKHWLVKTEPEVYSIDQLKKDRTTRWDCVRNYQARNYLQEMQLGDKVLIYHSNSDPSAIVGEAIVYELAIPDKYQFDPKSEYYDSKATKDNPRWFAPELKFIKKYPQPLSLNDLRSYKSLSKMKLMQKGSRLSVQPVDKAEFDLIAKLGNPSRSTTG
jgi:predicted RNA-binding protein with PUA-like domain